MDLSLYIVSLFWPRVCMELGLSPCVVHVIKFGEVCLCMMFCCAESVHGSLCLGIVLRSTESVI